MTPTQATESLLNYIQINKIQKSRPNGQVFHQKFTIHVKCGCPSCSRGENLLSLAIISALDIFWPVATMLQARFSAERTLSDGVCSHSWVYARTVFSLSLSLSLSLSFSLSSTHGHISKVKRFTLHTCTNSIRDARSRASRVTRQQNSL